VVPPADANPRREAAPADRGPDSSPPAARTPPPQARAAAVGLQTRELAVARFADRSVRANISARPDAPRPIAARAPLHPPVQTPPPVQVSIGRVEVHAAVAPAPPRTPPRAPSKPAMSLDDYLRRRDGGAMNGSGPEGGAT